ncbi:fibrillarin-like rRNA/tRNA 2'-O-methyltransferase [Halomicroarcula sp. F13]|uniref:Fibrillarin-like rRNA/tRNA 2'-O-methyltransferase n=1 Tax=Haloarcula rubra TaxID=2487747 RepID=A0AAW4PLJ6_9EURY|nr:fibrillarin-like rRNA/tRNA 2'-O-methyltransferase [Halomicroarcula rubra]MBX0321410.1 fibrillarin-like rRNA/tRNA 2'-O-methyltransferase [Halomicroarcula rubra]
MSLPDGVERHAFGGTTSIATRGHPEYGERTDGEWRRWDPHRSKLGAMLEIGMETGLTADQKALYLGAAAGTTASHVADFGGPTYAVEFAPRPTRDLLDVAERRPNLFPLLKDARKPETYAHVVEPVDVLVQDVATRGQGRVATLNRQFLREDGYLLAAIKARSEDVTADPEDVFDDVVSDIGDAYDVVATESLAPYHDDHLGVVARPRR